MRQRFHVNCFNDGANSIPFPEVRVRSVIRGFYDQTIPSMEP